jgi:hypothetical protein
VLRPAKDRIKRAAVRWPMLVSSALALASAGAGPSPAQTSPDPGIAASWVPREVNFTYVGFTTKYSCEGLKERVRHILLELGARDDLKVTSYGCERLAAPVTTPRVRIIMNVLEPAGTPHGEAVAAHWKRVDVLADRNQVDAALDCELIAQLKRDVLPLFATRQVDYSAACAANLPLVGGTRLKADVLVPDAASASTAAR